MESITDSHTSQPSNRQASVGPTFAARSSSMGENRTRHPLHLHSLVLPRNGTGEGGDAHAHVPQILDGTVLLQQMDVADLLGLRLVEALVQELLHLVLAEPVLP